MLYDEAVFPVTSFDNENELNWKKYSRHIHGNDSAWHYVTRNNHMSSRLWMNVNWKQRSYRKVKVL